MAAAEKLHKGFEDWDLEHRAERFRQHAETVRGHWEEPADDEEENMYSVTLGNLRDNVTAGMMNGTLHQIGWVEGSLIKILFGKCRCVEQRCQKHGQKRGGRRERGSKKRMQRKSREPQGGLKLW